MKRVLACAAAAALMAASCASYQFRHESVPALPPAAAALSGKSVGVAPVEVSFGAGRLAIDLRDLTMTVNGQDLRLERRYLVKEKDDFLGLIGVLDVNIFKKEGISPASVGLPMQELFVSALGGGHDYNVGFFKGLGESNMGTLSNRPYYADTASYPYKDVYSEPTGPVSLFSSVVALKAGEDPSAAGVDLVLKADFSVSSEVVELLENPPSSLADENGRYKRMGDYLLSMLGSMRYSLADARTGEVLVSQKSKSEWAAAPNFRKDVYIPVGNGDADSYAKYFRTVDLSPYALAAARSMVESVLPLLCPFYVNTSHRVKAE
jgi:hypothetical protein